MAYRFEKKQIPRAAALGMTVLLSTRATAAGSGVFARNDDISS